MRIALTLIVLVGLTCLSACKSKPKPEPGLSGPAPAVTAAEINAAKMQDAVDPQAVQAAFARDYPGAQISTIKLHSTSTGDSFYQIDFIRDGRPGIGKYLSTGAPLPQR